MFFDNLLNKSSYENTVKSLLLHTNTKIFHPIYIKEHQIKVNHVITMVATYDNTVVNV